MEKVLVLSYTNNLTVIWFQVFLSDNNNNNLYIIIWFQVTLFIEYFAHGYIAVSRNLVIFPNTIFFRHTNELRNFSLTHNNESSLFAAWNIVCFWKLQDSWCLDLLVLETKWLSGMLRWQHVVGHVRDVFKVTV